MFSSIIVEVTVGIALAGPVYAPGRRGLGRPIWNALGLLQDLELRLGLPPAPDAERERLQAWTSRIREAADSNANAFYARSFATDDLGTSALLLEWRDALVDAGWNGQSLGSPRVDALATLEGMAELPIGTSDRLVRVERALRIATTSPYSRLRLLDPIERWPGRWRRVFRELGARGATVERDAIEARFAHLPRSTPSSDLEWLQARLGGDERPPRIRGDGSLLILRSDTSTDLAELSAAMIATLANDGPTVVVRPKDPAPLDFALPHYGLAAQGVANRSTWRPAMQLLALVLELAFEPRDPYRVLELLTLPVGPFRGVLGAKLARAVARQPGIGGKEWNRQKADAASRLRARAAGDPKAANDIELRIERMRTWLEEPGAIDRIRRAELQSVVERVQGWLHGRLSGDDADVYAPAYAQSAALSEALRRDARADFSREDVRSLFDTFARVDHEHVLISESAGRVAHVPHPNCILEPCENLFVWNFVIGLERAVRRPPWSHAECRALAAVGVEFCDPVTDLRATNDAWRHATLSARKRVVFVVPGAIKGTSTSIHPFWDEIQARLGLDERGIAAITRTAHDVLARARGLAPTEPIAGLPLPMGRPTWTIPAGLLVARDSAATTSVTALERITSCPLAWVLEHRAGIASGAMSKVARGPLLNGNLAHRLVEILHHDRAFDLDEDAFLSAADTRLDELIRLEGVPLVLPGASVERLQLSRQLRIALRGLYRYLAESSYRIAAVEEEISVDSSIGRLHGRIDLRLVDHEGRNAVLDLKWGGSTFQVLLEKGRSIQLAVYVRALGGDPPGAYFALARGRLLTTDARMRTRTLHGPSLSETWQKVEATAASVLRAHSGGSIHVAAARQELPLLDALGVPPNERDRFYEAPPASACEYCEYDGICGRKWRKLT